MVCDSCEWKADKKWKVPEKYTKTKLFQWLTEKAPKLLQAIELADNMEELQAFMGDSEWVPITRKDLVSIDKLKD